MIDYLITKYHELFHPTKKERIALVGYGWSGKAFYETINKNRFIVDIYEQNQFFTNTPKLKYVLDDPKFQQSHNQNINYQKVDSIDYENKKIGEQEYDKIVIATGSVINDFGIKGIKDHCFFLKNSNDFFTLKNKLVSVNNKDPIIIIGGGPTGIEVGSHISTKCKDITIIDAFDILPGFTDKLKSHIKTEHNYMKYQIYNPVKEVIKINDNYVVKTLTKEGLPKYQSASLVIYTGGVKPSITNIPIDNKTIFTLGDLNRNGPPTAQRAVQEGKHLAKYIDNYQPFQFNELGKVLFMKNEIVVEHNKTMLLLPKWCKFFVDIIIDL